MSNEGKKVAETQIHAMCAYIRGQKCNECPASVDTLYGNGQPGCHAIAEETLLKARALLPDPASQVGRMRGVLERVERELRRMRSNNRPAPKYMVAELHEWLCAALAISPSEKCRTTISHGVVGVDDWHQEPCPDCSQPKHVCGARGFGEPGDTCLACEQPKAAQVGVSDEEIASVLAFWTEEGSGPTGQLIRRLALELQRLRQSRDAGRWIPWDVDADAITPESGWHLTTVRGCRGDDLRITGVANFAKDNVIAYWSIPLPPPYASQGDERG